MNSAKEKLLKKAYNNYLNLVLNDFPVERMDEIVADDIQGYGTTRDEKVSDISRLQKMVRDQREQGKGFEISFQHTPIHRRISPNEDMALYSDEFLLTMEAEGSKNTIPLRLSSIFEFDEKNWKLVHMHGSQAVDTENDTWHLNEWKKKNEALQKLVAEKTADLSKKNRELEIEAALEKVRSTALAMQKSEELAGLSMELVRQVQALGIETWFCAFNIYDEDGKGSMEWGSNGQGTFPKYRTPREGVFLRYYEAGQQGETLLINEIDENECPHHYEYLCSLPGVGEQLLKMKADGIPFPTSQIDHVAFFKYGYIIFITFKPAPEAHDIFKRFAAVFEQTYTRFLDLQKVEEQAREAQVELALERIRARVTAMKESSDLLDIVVSMRTEFLSLGHEAHYFWYMRWHPETYEKAMTSGDGTKIGMIMTLPRHIHGDIPLLADWEKSDEPTVVFAMDVETAVAYVDKMITLGDFKQVDPQAPTLDDIRHIKGLTFIMARTAYGEIGFSLPGAVPNPPQDALDTLVRFATVFDLAYSRFEDLKQAENRHRETQIELGLERVRARAMAMQNSNELSELVDTVFIELQKLDFELNMAIINIIDEAAMSNTVWAKTPETSDKPESYFMKFEDYPYHHEMFKAWKAQKTKWVYTLKAKEKSIYDDYLFNETEFKRFPMAAREAMRKSKQYVASFTFSNFGGIQTVGEEPLSEANLDILARFGKVFDLTYTRFNDLQKAEAQAKEAVKQASLDRVRGEIASMRTAEDLKRITPVIWNELQAVDVPFVRCGVFIMNDEQQKIQTYLSTPDGESLASFDLDYKAGGIASNAVKHWKKNKVFKDFWDEKQFMNFMQNLIDAGKVIDVESFQGKSAPPQSLYLNFVPFTQGMLYVGDLSPLTDEKLDLVKTLAEAFSIAYARYEDFKHLEEAKNKIESTLNELKSAQTQLVQAEKMASLGELTAGIAHEIQNPLNFVNNFSELNTELIEEARQEMDEGNLGEVKEILADIKNNEQKINHHGRRAESIVKSMLQHSRSNSGEKELTDLNALADEYLRLSYHGLRAKDKSFNAEFKTDFDEALPKINVVPQDIGRVLLNLINNAFQACTERGRGAGSEVYIPAVTVTTKKLKDTIEIRVKDNGSGIPEDIKDKIFEPFFTTKPTGEGTGLGLSMSYDIITKGHGGTIKVESKEGEGTEFTIYLKA